MSEEKKRPKLLGPKRPVPYQDFKGRGRNKKRFKPNPVSETAEPYCFLCGDPIAPNERSAIVDSTGHLFHHAHEDCFREHCVVDWFYPLEQTLERIKNLELRIWSLERDQS